MREKYIDLAIHKLGVAFDSLFFREYLATIYTDSALFRFFVEPQTNK